MRVCTPHPTHEAAVTAAAARGAHVLCEKPIAVDLASAGRMIAACDAAGATFNGSLAPFHELQIAEFVDAILSGREPAVTGREATKSLAILTAFYASAKSGRPEQILEERFA